MQGPQQNQDQSPAQKILQKMHDCIYVEPKGEGNCRHYYHHGTYSVKYQICYGLMDIQMLVPDT